AAEETIERNATGMRRPVGNKDHMRTIWRHGRLQIPPALRKGSRLGRRPVCAVAFGHIKTPGDTAAARKHYRIAIRRKGRRRILGLIPRTIGGRASLLVGIQPWRKRKLPDAVAMLVRIRTFAWRAPIAVEVERALIRTKLRTHRVRAAVHVIAQILRRAPAVRRGERDRQSIRLLRRTLDADHDEGLIGR